MEYEEFIKKSKKPDLKPFDTFTKRGPYSENGYVVIPDNFPIEYNDVFYSNIDTDPITELTFGGYVVEIDGELELLFLERTPFFDKRQYSDSELNEMEEIREKAVRAIGFEDNHSYRNELNAKDGANYLAEQLKKLRKNVNVNNSDGEKMKNYVLKYSFFEKDISILPRQKTVLVQSKSSLSAIKKLISGLDDSIDVEKLELNVFSIDSID